MCCLPFLYLLTAESIEKMKMLNIFCSGNQRKKKSTKYTAMRCTLSWITLIDNAKGYLVASLLLSICVSTALASDDIPFFTAEGNVSTERHGPNDTNILSRLDGKFLFSYSSNGVWQIQFTYGHSYPTTMPIGTVVDCKRIPDGIRHIITPPNNTNAPSASAVASLFPAMARQELFLPWLSLCPNSELPMVNKNRIHFDLRPEKLGNPKNEGGFKLSYIKPGNHFLSELIVTNNGTIFLSDGNDFKLPAPFDKGYVQFSYEVLDVTNYNGLDYPLNVVLYQFALLPTSKTAEDVYAAVISRLSVDTIDANKSSLKLIPVPIEIIALDSRPSGLSKGVTVNYGVLNDQWSSVTNKLIQQVAASLKGQSFHKIGDERNYSRNRVIIMWVLGITLLIPVWILVKHKKTKI